MKLSYCISLFVRKCSVSIRRYQLALEITRLYTPNYAAYNERNNEGRREKEREKKEEDIRRHTVGGPDVLKLSQREKRGKIFRVFFHS